MKTTLKDLYGELCLHSKGDTFLHGNDTHVPTFYQTSYGKALQKLFTFFSLWKALFLSVRGDLREHPYPFTSGSKSLSSESSIFVITLVTVN